jgi:hypothetical protein
MGPINMKKLGLEATSMSFKGNLLKNILTDLASVKVLKVMGLALHSLKLSIKYYTKNSI